MYEERITQWASYRHDTRVMRITNPGCVKCNNNWIRIRVTSSWFNCHFRAARMPDDIQYHIIKRREEKPTRCHWMVYCIYNMLNMFGHFYAHHQKLETICVLLPPMVCSALVAGCRSQVQQQAVRPGRGMLQHPSSWTHSLLQHPSSWTHSLLACTWQPATKHCTP